VLDPSLPVSANSPVGAEVVAEGVGEVVLGEVEFEGEVVAVGLGDAEVVGEDEVDGVGEEDWPRTTVT